MDEVLERKKKIEQIWSFVGVDQKQRQTVCLPKLLSVSAQSPLQPDAQKKQKYQTRQNNRKTN